MEFVIALAAEYSVVRNPVSGLTVLFAAATTYLSVSSHGQSAQRYAFAWRILLVLGMIAVGYAAFFEERQLRQLLGLHPVVYLIEACLLLCLPVGLLAWVRRRHPREDQPSADAE